MNINWYPGHMAKARRMIEESLSLVDMTVELVDARIPMSSRNPDIDRILNASNKPRMIILNKSDLADPNMNKQWLNYYKSQGINAILYNSKTSGGSSAVIQAVRNVFKERIARDAAKGIVNRSIKIMVLGIPNVGKSTFINNVSGTNKARAEDRPGITRTKQWVRISDGVDLLDMPGILWPKLEDQRAALRLALIGSIKDEVIDTEELAMKLAGLLARNYKPMLTARYKLPDELPEDDWELLKLIGKKRGFVISGGEIDTERTSLILLDEFRGCKIGKITLEEPPKEQENG